MIEKEEALKQISILESQLANLRKIVEAPKINPKDLVGKLCYVWDDHYETKIIQYIDSYSKESFPYSFKNSRKAGWKNAEPLSKEVVLGLIYGEPKEFRCDWSLVPSIARFMYTDRNGDIFWSTKEASADNISGKWIFHIPMDRGCDWDFIYRGHISVENWGYSKEERPEGI